MTLRCSSRSLGPTIATVTLAVATAALLVISQSWGSRASAQGATTTTVDCATLPSTGADNELRVATKPLEPFVFVDGSVADSTAVISGFSIDYWHAVADRLGVTSTWCLAESVDDIIDLAASNAVDASIAGISITEGRERVIDFSQPYYNSGQQIAVTAGGSSTAGTLLGLVFSGAFLVPVAILLLLVLVVSHLVWFFERGHDSDDFPYEYRSGIGEAIWWSTVSVITGGEAVKNIICWSDCSFLPL